MPTWTGWINEFLNAAGIIITPPNRTFMSEWANHAPGSCKNNPVDLTHAVTGSTRCGATVGGFGRTQNYPSHQAAANAFAYQMGVDWTKPLRQALNSGNPFQINDRTDAIAVLNRWASPSFASWYSSATASGQGGGGAAGEPTSIHKGWDDLRRSVNHKTPKSLHNSRKAQDAALRQLQNARRVKL